MPIDTTFKFNDVTVKEHLAKIEKIVNEQQGKKNHNPFLWLSKNVNPLIERYRGYTDSEDKKHTPERTKELQDAILALPLEIPHLNLSVDTNPTDYNIQRDKPVAGLNIPQKNI